METTVLHRIPNSIFALIFPDECRLCGEALREISRVPVCPKCLAKPSPLIADHYCADCRTPFVTAHPLDGDGRCGLCRRGLAGFDAAYSFGSYEAELRQLVHLFKYGRIRALAEPLGAMMAAALPRGEAFEAIVPMPLHWLKRWQRGFNQARLLAEVLSRRTGIPVTTAARRARSTTPQAGLSNSQRRRNVGGAFRASRRHRLQGASVLLVDDVLTTGATASACALSLKRVGVRRVSVLVLARTDRRQNIEIEQAQTVTVGVSQ